MKTTKEKGIRRIALDIGYSSIGWAVQTLSGKIEYGTYLFENDDSDISRDLAEMRRDGKRRESRDKRKMTVSRLVADTGLFPSVSEYHRYVDRQKSKRDLWKIVERSFKEAITPEEFSLLLYRFSKRRGNVDMTGKFDRGSKKKNSAQDDKEEKEYLSARAEMKKRLDGKTWLEGIIDLRREYIKKTREALKNIGKKANITVDEVLQSIDSERFPYTNALSTVLENIVKELSRLLEDAGISSSDRKTIVDKMKEMLPPLKFPYPLDNRGVVDSILKIGQIQMERFGQDHPIFSESFLKKWEEIVTDRGKAPSTEEKVGFCLSGNGKKRHPNNSYDAENSRIAELLHADIVRYRQDSESGNFVYDAFKLKDTGISFEELRDLLIALIEEKKTKKTKIAEAGLLRSEEIIKGLQNRGYLPRIPRNEKGGYFFKKTRRMKDKKKAIIIRLEGHRWYHCEFPERLLKLLLDNHTLRDRIEFALGTTYDREELETKLQTIAREFDIDLSESDMDALCDLPTSGFSGFSNEAHRKILPALIEGVSFNEALKSAYPENDIDKKTMWRNTLSFDAWIESQRDLGMPPNPALERIVKETVWVFNRVVSKFGACREIVIETTREANNPSRAEEIMKRQRENRKRRFEIERFLQSIGKPVSEENVRRLICFIEQGGKLTWGSGEKKSAVSPLSGNPICIEMALDGTRTELDHIIPRKAIRDNSLSNLELIFKNENQEKGERTPVEYLMEKYGYTQKKAVDTLRANIKKTKIPASKKERILMKKTAREIRHGAVEKESMDVGMLSATGTASKVIRNLCAEQLSFGEPGITMEKARARVLAVSGRMTSDFRKAWLRKKKDKKESGEERYERSRKNRSALWHHAIDALVMLNFDASTVQRWATARKRAAEEANFVDAVIRGELRIEPTIENFVDLVEKANREYEGEKRVVVRRVERSGKIRGRVFKQTLYSPNDDGGAKVTVRKDKGRRQLMEGGKTLVVCRDRDGRIHLHVKHPALKKPRIPQDQEVVTELCAGTLVYLHREHSQKPGIRCFYIVGVRSDCAFLEPANFARALVEKSGKKRGYRLEEIRAGKKELKVIETIRKLDITGKMPRLGKEERDGVEEFDDHGGEWVGPVECKIQPTLFEDE
ncbi:type II CRISPR RNA-guided endonuclease Cas9 [Nitratifractor sp.]